MNKKRLLLATVLGASMALAACDDSGSSSSGSSVDLSAIDAQSNGGETSVNRINDFSQYAGRYTGVLNVKYKASMLSINASREEQVVIDIKRNGDATVTVDGRSETVKLDGDRIVITRNVNVNYEDINCQGDIVVNAKLERENIFGTGSGDGSCGNEDLSTPVEVDANLSLQKQ